MKFYLKIAIAIIICMECIPACFIFITIGLGYTVWIGPFSFSDSTFIPWLEAIIAIIPVFAAGRLIAESTKPEYDGL